MIANSPRTYIIAFSIASKARRPFTNCCFFTMGSAVSGKTNDDNGIINNANANANQRTSGGYYRRASHAGSWYSDDEDTLDRALSRYLSAAAKREDDDNDEQQQQEMKGHRHASNSNSSSSLPSLRAIICPHAGFSYSGPTAAYGYRALEQELSKKDSPIRRILVFHPSHHVYLDGCAVSGARTIETPLGDLPVDMELRDEILALKSNNNRRQAAAAAFTVMDRDVDEAEHSGEMQYPYIAKAQKNANQKKGGTSLIPILPIMCGNISNAIESEYGNLLTEIVSRKDVFSIVSTDFCHWGKRFSYQPKPTTPSSSTRIAAAEGTSTTTVEIFEYIQNLDRQGMRHIEMKKPGAFAEYLKETRNTICGRHAIQTWLNAVVHSETTSNSKNGVLDIEFNKYAQSSKVRSMRESSVSYASALATVSRP